jgi:hypothetical protein
VTDVFEVIFRSFWTWAGTLVLVIYGLGIVCNCVVRVVEVIANRSGRNGRVVHPDPPLHRPVGPSPPPLGVRFL